MRTQTPMVGYKSRLIGGFEIDMRKLYMAVAAAAVFMFSQIAHAIPTIDGATDIATHDADTYYSLTARDDGWFVEGYTSTGGQTGFSVQLTPSVNVTPTNQVMVGLAFDGTNFYTLRDDSISTKGTDTWSVLTFNLNGQFTGDRLILGPNPAVAPSKQKFVGFDIADEGFLALRNDAAGAKGTDTWRVVGFDTETGVYNGYNNILDAAPSAVPYVVLAAYNNSPVALLPSTNVPEPSTGLLLAGMLGLGLLGRKKLS